MRGRREYGRSGTVHMVKFMTEGAIESYCGSTRQDIYSYTLEKDRITCDACLYKIDKEEVHNGE